MVKYVSADSAALIQGLTTNIAAAKGITKQLSSGSQYLINSVGGEQLSGAAYNAGQGLFQELILPTIDRVGSAIDSLKDELGKYQAADGTVSRWAVIDEAIQQALIDSYKRQIAIIDFQIESSKKLGLVGKLAKSALEAIAYNNQRLEQARKDIQEKIREEQEKLEALVEFQAETSGLFQDSLNQLKIGMQAVEILSFTTVNPETGAYKLPDGFDSSWFTSVKSTSVTEVRKQAVLTRAMEDLQLPEEAQKYYQDIMKKALKGVPVEQWGSLVQELNQILLFDSEGNILDVGPLGVGNLKKIIVSKNGKYDSALTTQATNELTSEQLEAFKENFPQLALGVMEFLTGLGIVGLDLAGTYFSGGTLAMVGISQAAAVTGTAITAGGALTVTDAINKMGLATAQCSFVQTYSQYHKDLTPNNEYTAGEHDYHYKTDDLGRLEHAGPDVLKPKTHKGRLKHNPNTPGKEPGDQAGHAFADRFGGSPELNNLFSQSSKVNLSQFKKIENSWAKALNQGKEVVAEIKANYNGTSPRPVSFEIKWSIDGAGFSEILTN